jgi:hypothetical protein
LVSWCFVWILLCVFLLPAAARGAGTPAPPPELIQLEREVSLKMAHARDEGYTDEPRRKMLLNAQKADAEAEKAIKGGEYERAESDLLQAKLLLHNLGI